MTRGLSLTEGKAVLQARQAVGANRAVIVIPGRARTAWRIGQLAPGLAEQRMRGAVGAERKGRA